MEAMYRCMRCKKEYPLKGVRYVETKKGFELVCINCIGTKRTP